ncbi:Alpha/beta hydrolase [Amycolatopsis marina]|uniref:Alpha/beta hydrolase n=1 Tax=Amycolatopsis marina TaxID=490629 RepID=A0A1I0XVF8_9PSEU|nr:alpha/beta hydrolase [Amycolatopsis marina]SFB04894.1 Alpha/beta hydrolase [Amycolatopsis marina]
MAVVNDLAKRRWHRVNALTPDISAGSGPMSASGRGGGRGGKLVAVLTALAIALTTVVSTRLVPAGTARSAPPVGIGAWLSDSRNLPDPARTDPDAVASFLAAMDPAERRELVVRYPGVVGALNGAPPELRYLANRSAMTLAGAPYQDWAGNFLLFDQRGSGRVAQVFGDLSTADRIAVLVPGVGNRGDNFLTGLGGRSYRSPAVQAADLYRAAVRHGRSGDRVAVIAWLGYDAPGGVGIAAARRDLAQAGANELEQLVAGLTAIRPQATIMLLGHSYGGVVVGLAASRLPWQVTDIAVFGSPGMGVDSVRELGTTARVWAGQSGGDWIRWVPGVRLFGIGHGTKPTDPDFGACTFGTVDVPDHDHYLSPGTDSLANLARIVTPGSGKAGSGASAARLRCASSHAEVP